MPQLDLEADNVAILELTADDVRTFTDDPSEDHKDLLGALDSAQGPVFTGEEPVRYLVIKITR